MASDTLPVKMDHQLIDDGLWPERYVTGRLDPAERAQFEGHFVDCSSCLDRIEAAEALAAGVKAASAASPSARPARTRPSPPRWALRSRWAIAGACAAGLLAVLWVNTSRRRMEEEVASERRSRAEAMAETAMAQNQLQKERAARQDAEARLDAQRPPPVRVPVLALLATRGADGPTLELPKTAQPVVLSVEREEPPRFGAYLVNIHSEAGGEVWQGRILPSSRDAVVFAIDSSFFGLGKYVLSLEGEEPGGRKILLGRYSFRTVAASKN